MDWEYYQGMDNQGMYYEDQLNAYAIGAPQDGETRFWVDMNPSKTTGYIRDPHRLITYLIPFPRPTFADGDPSKIPERFLVYTPPPPPLVKPGEGVKEGKIRLMRRKWQQHMRNAKTSTAKTESWKGMTSQAMKGISWAGNKTTTSNLDFLSRVVQNNKQRQEPQEEHSGEDEHAEEDGVVEEAETTENNAAIKEIVLVYPPTTGLNPDQMREEFVNTILRAKSKAQRDAIISTALLPVTIAIDIVSFLLFLPTAGALTHMDGLWAMNTVQGARTARSIIKRLSSSDSEEGERQGKGKLQLHFILSESLEVMGAYLLAKCQRQDSELFPGSYEGAPTEEDVLRAIAWSPTEREQNWEEEQREVTDAKLDLKNVIKKGAKEWISWCRSFHRKMSSGR